MNAIESLWSWNREIAVKVESHVSLIEGLNRQKAEEIEKRDKALASKDFETYEKMGWELDSTNRVLATFAMELVALLKQEATPESSDEPTQPDEPTSEPLSSADDDVQAVAGDESTLSQALSSGDYPPPRPYALMNPTRDYFDHLEAWRSRRNKKAQTEDELDQKKEDKEMTTNTTTTSDHPFGKILAFNKELQARERANQREIERANTSTIQNGKDDLQKIMGLLGIEVLLENIEDSKFGVKDEDLLLDFHEVFVCVEGYEFSLRTDYRENGVLNPFLKSNHKVSFFISKDETENHKDLDLTVKFGTILDFVYPEDEFVFVYKCLFDEIPF